MKVCHNGEVAECSVVAVALSGGPAQSKATPNIIDFVEATVVSVASVKDVKCESEADMDSVAETILQVKEDLTGGYDSSKLNFGFWS